MQVWGDRCFFAPFGLPGSKLEGIKAALVDLLVRRISLSTNRPLAVCVHLSFEEAVGHLHREFQIGFVCMRP